MPSIFGDLTPTAETPAAVVATGGTGLAVASTPGQVPGVYLGSFGVGAISYGVVRDTGGWVTIDGLGIVAGRQPRDPANAKEPARVDLEAMEALEPAFQAEYRALATEIGLGCSALDTERFKTFMVERGLTLYARADVDEYLHHKYRVPEGNITAEVSWGWRPLRESDRTKGQKDTHNGVVQRGVKAYQKPVPYPVLLTVKAIIDAFPTARFFVSDEMHAERIPDPFLLVEIGTESFVVERWDEPSFREKSK